MLKKTNNDKRFLTSIQKKLKLTKKEIAESEVWIDGFKTAVNSCEKIGMFPKWQPIETAPKDGTVILGWYLGASFVVEMSFTPEENKFWAGIDDKYIYLDSSNFSHWMPLPPDPNESK
jgi:hypothetical protein